MGQQIRTLQLLGYQVTVDDALGKLAVEHPGEMPWDDLFRIKNMVWGEEARAIEIYPRKSDLVNSIPCRHLWRLGEADFCPDLLGPAAHDDRLQSRYVARWTEARSR
ncbi:MAG: DUF7694 domain-containing protein [Paracoccaceae bacterium]